MLKEEYIANKLLKTKQTIAIAESCTGGLISHLLTNIPNASKFLIGSIISYSNHSKVKVLKVKKETLKKYGAVSKECALEMAEGAKSLLKSDISLAISGIAGPGGGTKTKPIGTVAIACINKNNEKFADVFYFKNKNRLQNKKIFAKKSMAILLREII